MKTSTDIVLRPASQSPHSGCASQLCPARQALLDALPVAAAVLGREREEVILIARNAPFARLEARTTGRDNGELLTRVRAAGAIGRVLDGESAGEKLDWRDGGRIDGRHFTVAVAPVRIGPDAPLRALVTLIDRTSEVQVGESLRRQMLTDPLTGLANRVGFVEGLEARIADDGPAAVGVLLVDLAGFSRVNDCMGTLGGDELIITVARRLMTLMRGSDWLGRTGANEFAIALHTSNGADDVERVADRVQAALAQPFRLSDFEIRVDCAIGCAAGDEQSDEGDAETLIGKAQLALKASKRSRRVESYQPAALDAARRRFTIETELRRAIEADQLTLAYQPLISLATGKVSGFEALARWTHPDYGMITPNEFIPVAEDCGLIVPLGRWALDRAMQTLAEWDATAARELPLYMSINLSAIQIQRDDIAASVATALRTYRLSGHRLSLELTESAIVSDPQRAARTLDALKQCDALVAMDDFGTGFSNLASLQRLPIDVLKIDRSFVSDMLDDPDKVAIVRAILTLAQTLGMTTTAEGIETPELARTLAALGCTTGQGFHYARPLAPDAALTFALNSLR